MSVANLTPMAPPTLNQAPPTLTQSQIPNHSANIITAPPPAIQTPPPPSPVSYVRALYDYTARGQRNAYGEIDLR